MKGTFYCFSKQADGEGGVVWGGGGCLSIELREIGVKFVPVEGEDEVL
jgi:hypothetical protein